MDLLASVVFWRIIGEWYYPATFGLLMLAFTLIYKRGIFKFGMLVYAICVLFNFAWELAQYLLGIRSYDAALPAAAQLVYQSLVEFGPPMLIFIVILDKFGLLNLEDFK